MKTHIGRAETTAAIERARAELAQERGRVPEVQRAAARMYLRGATAADSGAAATHLRIGALLDVIAGLEQLDGEAEYREIVAAIAAERAKADDADRRLPELDRAEAALWTRTALNGAATNRQRNEAAAAIESARRQRTDAFQRIEQLGCRQIALVERFPALSAVAAA